MLYRPGRREYLFASIVEKRYILLTDGARKALRMMRYSATQWRITMISKTMADRINLQINREMFSAYLYLAMAAKMKETGYAGIGTWLTVQYHEEMFHAMKFAAYLESQGAPEPSRRAQSLRRLTAPSPGSGHCRRSG